MAILVFLVALAGLYLTVEGPRRSRQERIGILLLVFTGAYTVAALT